MSPIPGWLAGAQAICLNMSSLKGIMVDFAVQLHFALFARPGGYVLKPQEMVSLQPEDASSGGLREDYWPPPREVLHRATITVISLHGLPKVCRAPNESSHATIKRARDQQAKTCTCGPNPLSL
eukprot:1229520-Prymnesium_polylepis.2